VVVEVQVKKRKKQDFLKDPEKLRPYIGAVRNRVYRAGVELEGGWKDNPTWKGLGVAVAHDGSVFKNKEQGQQIRPTGIQLIGEVASAPLEPIAVPAWMRAMYPAKVDATCGLHVHMSFYSPRHYSQLMDTPLLVEAMKMYLAEWGKEEGLPKTHCLWERLKGKHEYCTDKFWPDLQATSGRDHDRERDGNRYTIINYGWLVNETIECRVLPMMDTADQGIRAVKKVLDITNAVLAATAEREEKLAADIVVKDVGIFKQGWRVRV
jgi:hypothetical protein